MPIINVRPNRVRPLLHICRLQEPNRDALVPDAGFIGDSADDVLNQLLEIRLAKDRDLTTWRAEHPLETVTARPRRHAGGIHRANAEPRV